MMDQTTKSYYKDFRKQGLKPGAAYRVALEMNEAVKIAAKKLSDSVDQYISEILTGGSGYGRGHNTKF